MVLAVPSVWVVWSGCLRRVPRVAGDRIRKTRGRWWPEARIPWLRSEASQPLFLLPRGPPGEQEANGVPSVGYRSAHGISPAQCMWVSASNRARAARGSMGTAMAFVAAHLKGRSALCNCAVQCQQQRQISSAACLSSCSARALRPSPHAADVNSQGRATAVAHCDCAAQARPQPHLHPQTCR